MSETQLSTLPSFRVLGRQEAEAILARHHIGRLAFSLHDRVDIEPIHYVYVNEWIYGRTVDGTKMETISHNPLVAFEVDEGGGLFDWRSVVVKGVCEIIPRDTTSQHIGVSTHAIDLVRRLAPDAFMPDDRVPFRHVLFRIHLDEVTAREASSAGG